MSSSIKKPPIVFIVAHPDDLSHSMGGTAYLLKKDYDLHVFCLTKGEYGIKGKTPAEAAAVRELEEQAACEILEAKLTFLNQIDAHTFADKEICEKVAGLLKAIVPDAVFTLWPINEHPDHVVVHNIAIKSLLLAGLYQQTELYFSENAMGVQTNQFNPDIYVDISEVIEIKRNLVRCHHSQNPLAIDVERMIQRNVFRGMLNRCSFAEGFKTNYPIIVNSKRKVGTVLLGLKT
jgi:LmbE family N-acetylglucosaminyl deacetylase